MQKHQYRWTVSLISILLLVSFVLGANYFLRPFERWWGREGSKPISPLLGDEESTQVVGLKQANEVGEGEVALIEAEFEKLSDVERIDQVLAIPDQVWEKLALTQVKQADEKEATTTAQAVVSSQVSPGFVILYGAKRESIAVAQEIELLKARVEAEKPALFVAVDHEGGRVQRLNGNGFLNLPSWRQLCAQNEVQRRLQLSQSARELASVGVDLVFAPLVDVATESAILGDRVCAGDPSQVATASATFIQEFLRAGVEPVIKHYPGIGGVRRDLHQAFDTQSVSVADVRPFHSLLQEYPTLSVMTSLMGVKEILPHQPCALSAECLAPFRETYQRALLFTDALTMEAAAYDPETGNYGRSLAERAVRALEAGNHVLVFGPELTEATLTETRQALLTLYQLDLAENPLRKQVDEAVKRILEFKSRQQRYNNGREGSV